MKREYFAIITRDSDGYYVASVPELRGCRTQAKSMDKLIERVKEAIELCLEDEDDEIGENSDFVGIHRVWV